MDTERKRCIFCGKSSLLFRYVFTSDAFLIILYYYIKKYAVFVGGCDVG